MYMNQSFILITNANKIIVCGMMRHYRQVFTVHVRNCPDMESLL